MKVQVTYLQSEFDAAVAFLMKNNQMFEGTKSEMTKSLLDTIKSMKDAAHGSICSRGTLGYLVSVYEIIEEKAKSEKCEVLVKIEIDPDFLRAGSSTDSSEDYEWLAAFMAGMCR